MRLRNGCSGIWIAVLAAVLDRVTKAASLYLPAGQRTVLVPGVVNLLPATNTGMAFSMFSGGGDVLTAVAILLTAGLAAWLIARPQSQTKLMRAGLWMVVGGGLGNVYDRLLYGHVIDFIEPAFVRFAVFNVADAFICIGVALTAVAVILDERRKDETHE